MGSVGNQNPWAPYNEDDYKDYCSHPICSISCPQFCYFFFPPPPAVTDSAGPLSPLVIAVIAVLAGAFLLVGYYTVVTRYCRRRPAAGAFFAAGDGENVNHRDHQELIRCRAGLDESLIRAIAVREYVKGDRTIEGTECAVCLADFQEKEPLRILPKCGHAFHLPCIDTWLRSQSSCPLCRAGVVVVLARPTTLQDQYVALDVDTGERQRGDIADLILVIDDDGNIDNNNNNNDNDSTGGINVVRRFGRSVSLGARRKLLASGGMESEEGEKDRCRRGIGSSSITDHAALKRSVSTGQL